MAAATARVAEHEQLQGAAAACEARTQALLEEAGAAAAKHATLEATLTGTETAQAESQARGDKGRCGEMWGDMGRYGAIWEDIGRRRSTLPSHHREKAEHVP